MKGLRVFLVSTAVLLGFETMALGECASVQGDVTSDGLVDVLDVQCAILSALHVQGPESDPAGLDCLGGEENLLLSDLSCSGTVNVVDVVMSLSYALQTPLNEAIDGDGDNCPDACQVSPLAPTDPGAPMPEYALENIQPASADYGETIGVDGAEGVTVVMLLASW